MKLIFERSRPGRGNDLLPSLDVPAAPLPEKYRRKTVPRLPELGESDLSRHYQALARRAFGVCDGFYPLGSCTMKYNPKLGEELAALPGVSLTASNDHDFELVPAGVNKGRALALLALMWGIPLERCAAVGDSANDLEMLQAVGCPIAMGNAAPQVQAAAVRTVADNGHDGAAQAILSCLE